MSYQNAEPAAPARLGRYELIGLLATGGMAEIHLARLAGEAGFEKIVVVKRLLPELVASKAFVAMFLDEGKLVARLDHPNICEVHELGRDGAEYFLVMPYLDGVAATELIAQPRDPDRVTQLRVATGVIVQACAGLHQAHELRDADGTAVGLVHRDVSPSNLFVTTKGVVKVLDFGIAKVRGATETEVGTVKGKTQYMAPEQLLGEVLDRRADVFALGIVLYELATHQRLFKRASDYLAARAILEEPIPRADEADPAIPRALAEVIAKSLARTPADRYVDAHELASALEAAIQPHGGVATAPQIAKALAEHHAENLTAQRTRQAKVVSSAAAKAPVPASDTPPTVAASKRALLEVATTDVKASPVVAPVDGRGTVTTSSTSDLEAREITDARGDGYNFSSPGAHRRWRWIVAGLAGGGALAVLAVMLATHGSNEPTRITDGSAREARAVATGSSDTVGSATPSGGSDPSGSAAVATTTGLPSPVRSAPPNGRATSPQPHGPAPKKLDHHRIAGSGAQPGGLAVEVSAAQPSSGFFSIDAKPYADIFVDGSPFGQTPLVHKSLPAGKHHLKAVRADGATKTYDVTIPANGTAAAIHVAW
ncbi:MAG: serine/threonine-protein kinase [Deltaproteobacteria bacterium]